MVNSLTPEEELNTLRALLAVLKAKLASQNQRNAPAGVAAQGLRKQIFELEERIKNLQEKNLPNIIA